MSFKLSSVNIGSLIGIVGLLVATCLGYFWGFEESWMVSAAVLAVSFIKIVKEGISTAGVSSWKGYVVAAILFVGGCFVVCGGMDSDGITTLIGVGVVLLGFISTYVIKKISSSST